MRRQHDRFSPKSRVSYRPRMAKTERPATQFVGEDDQMVHATWSRSGKNLILTVAPNRNCDAAQQVLLSREDARGFSSS